MRQLATALPAWEELGKYSSLTDFKSAWFDTEHELTVASGLRSLCWKIFLLFQNLDRTSWPASLYNSRSAYESLRAHYLRAIEHPDEVGTAVDPLNTDSESPWTALRSDEALRTEIFQDVERCMPENVYFRQPATQGMMLDILFIYCKLNPDVGYRQGMHELLAPILWAVERDAVDIGHTGTRKLRPQGDMLLSDSLDARYIEHDTFTLFGIVMQTAKSFYDPATDVRWQKKEAKSRGRPTNMESAIIVRCRRIFNELLPRVDPELASHLNDLEISPQVFLMRWIRLLFGREFPFDDLLHVWDLLFAEDPSLELVDYVCVAMLLRIRWQLISADMNEALMLLMRYPGSAAPYEPSSFVRDAIFLRANTGVDGGITIVTKYSGRAPARANRLERPSTPTHSIVSGSPGSRRARSPFGSPAVSAVETVLSDAVGGVINRGERWGLNQALRDAVGEVRKNVQGLSSGRGSPKSGSLSGIGSLHRSSKSDVSSTIAANVLRKITALEERNKQLAKMLETAVAELWKFEKEASEHKTVEDRSLQALGMAVAKVQFVQVFLQDSTLPLPADERNKTSAPPLGTETNPDPLLEPPTRPNNEQVKAPNPQHLSPSMEPVTVIATNLPGSTPIPVPLAVRPSSTQTPPPSLPTTSLSATHASAPTAAALAQLGRPKLEQSSFSWMLGQAHDDRSGFVTASPFSPHEIRHNAAHGGTEKGFLFGEEDDVVGEVKSQEKKKGKMKVRANSVLRKQEDIGLGDMGSNHDPKA